MNAKTVRELLLEWLDWPTERHPITRSGERDPIAWVVRVSVGRRDGFSCRRCGSHMPEMDGMELDHILPWSAGGGDHSGNLRTLCHHCNQKRSNWNDGDHEREMVPTTWWCQTCWLAPDIEAEMGDEYLDNHSENMRRPRRVWGSGIDLNRVPYVRELTTLAYCAWCGGYGHTDQAFTSDRQAELVALLTPASKP